MWKEYCCVFITHFHNVDGGKRYISATYFFLFYHKIIIIHWIAGLHVKRVLRLTKHEAVGLLEITLYTECDKNYYIKSLLIAALEIKWHV